jgi:hypothetical protein
MKQGFELCLFISNIKHLLQLEETIKIINKPGPEVFDVLDINLKVNQTSLVLLKDFLYKQNGINYQDHIERIYFGQETCENLIPSIEDVENALRYCSEHEFGFSFVTPYVAPKGIRKIIDLLDFLNTCEEEVEVVINDFGILQLVYTRYNNLKPVLGRLLTKLKRDPRFSLSGYDISNSDIKNIKKVEQNQAIALQSAGIDMPQFRKFLKEKNIDRIGFDSVPQGLNPKSLKKWDFEVDVYWPWVYITSGRNCAIAAYTQPGKSFHPTDEPCSFQCRSYEFTFESDKQMLNSVQQGNAVWMDSQSLYEQFFPLDIGRLVYEPYIPI